MEPSELQIMTGSVVIAQAVPANFAALEIRLRAIEAAFPGRFRRIDKAARLSVPASEQLTGRAGRHVGHAPDIVSL